MGQHYDSLKLRLAEAQDLRRASAVLGWDQETYMPEKGVDERSEQLSTLGRLAHETFTSPATGKLLREAAKEEDVQKNRVKSAVVRVNQYDYTLSKKIPADFVAQMSKAQSQGTTAWARARKENNFPAFAPYLKKNVENARRVADYLGWTDHPYDALLNSYERGAKTAEVRAVFAGLREQLVPLVKAITANASRVSDAPVNGKFPKAAQEEFARLAATQIGYDFSRGQLSYTNHPFCTTFGHDDVRITSRADETFFNTMFFGVLHESGHAMYEQGVSKVWARTGLDDGTSMAVHESQSRMWENQVGRSREFWQWAYPILQTHMPQFKKVKQENFYKAINKVEPSLIRVEADEVTYSLHIMIRFEMEIALIEGSLKTKDVPEAWNAKYHEYLGITPPNDAQGCLQDIHWSSGLMGYFPTYALGSILSAQLFETAEKKHPGLRQEFAQGKFDTLLAWLNKNVHEPGRSLTPGELIQKATGRPLDVAPYMAYLTSKYGDIYGL